MGFYVEAALAVVLVVLHQQAAQNRTSPQDHISCGFCLNQCHIIVINASSILCWVLSATVSFGFTVIQKDGYGGHRTHVPDIIYSRQK